MELLLVRDLAMIGALVGLVALVLVFLDATRAPPMTARTMRLVGSEFRGGRAPVGGGGALDRLGRYGGRSEPGLRHDLVRRSVAGARAL